MLRMSFEALPASSLRQVNMQRLHISQIQRPHLSNINFVLNNYSAK